MATKLAAARQLTWFAARKYDTGQRADLEASMPKQFASEAAMEIARSAVRIHGEYGYSTEFDVERYFRDAPLMIVCEGTNEIRRNVITRQQVEKHAEQAQAEYGDPGIEEEVRDSGSGQAPEHQRAQQHEIALRATDHSCRPVQQREPAAGEREDTAEADRPKDNLPELERHRGSLKCPALVTSGPSWSARNAPPATAKPRRATPPEGAMMPGATPSRITNKSVIGPRRCPLA
jgi:Acyl-CoA dehydrogenase, C-terminal domain